MGKKKNKNPLILLEGHQSTFLNTLRPSITPLTQCRYVLELTERHKTVHKERNTATKAIGAEGRKEGKGKRNLFLYTSEGRHDEGQVPVNFSPLPTLLGLDLRVTD